MTLTDVMLVVPNSCTLIIIPNDCGSLKEQIICQPKDIPLEHIDCVVNHLIPLGVNLIQIQIFK